MFKINSFFQKIIVIAIILCAIGSSLNAQLATWPLSTKNAIPTPVAPNVVAGNLLFGTPATFTSGGFKTGYLQFKQSNLWPNSPTNAATQGFYVDFPISPAAGYDLWLTGCTFQIPYVNNVGSSDFPTSHINFSLAYQIDGIGAWIPFATQQGVVLNTISSALPYTVNFGTINIPFYNKSIAATGHTYAVRLYMYSIDGANKAHYFGISNFILNGTTNAMASVNTVTTNAPNAATISKYSAIGTASYNGSSLYQTPSIGGLTWATTVNPTIAANPFSVDILTTGNINNPTNATNIINLTPATTYHLRAYITTPLDTIYGNDVSFTTLPYSVPNLATNAATNVLSTKATTGGSNIDSGGYAVSEKGVCYATTNSPTYSGLHSSDGTGNANFSTQLKGLLPSTKYYMRAYAKNQLGIGYGNLDSFTTAAPVPNITVTPNNIDFGDVTYNTTIAPILSYKVNASYLTPASGVITLNVSNSNYSIKSTINGTPAASITIPYTGGTITNKIIYVSSITNTYGALTAKVFHTGGGTVAPNADTLLLATNVVQNQDTLSNAGSDFWCGFGYQEKMSENAGSIDEAKLSIYVTTGNQAATVHVDLTSGGYSQTQTIPANSYYEFKNFPTGDPNNDYNGAKLPDSRLYATGISQKSIHIYTDNSVPVSAFMHSYTSSNTAAGAMLFPSNTWNSNYVVQSFGGQTNNSNPNSYFFVIANEDNTNIWITPKNDILDSIQGGTNSTLFKENSQPNQVKYHKDSTYLITLQKGDVFNAMGYIQGQGANNATGLDLSGSIVKTTCNKKITVFSGNGRCLIPGLAGCTEQKGSDHLIQQMFPQVAWGTKYVTMPTKNQPLNYFRIYVSNPTLYGATKVWINNPTHTTALNTATLVNNLYYEFQTAQPSLIESDKPINVTQFMLTPKCVNTVIDAGPEMIILSPIQQAITQATVYSASGKFKTASQTPANGASSGSASSYINVIIPTIDTGNFKLDGSNMVDTGKTLSLYANGIKIRASKAFKTHPQDATYSYASFWVLAPAAHTLAANKGFNAIAYGMGDGETYGYNAGTAINNLSSITVAVNPYGTDTSSGSVKAVKNNALYLQVAVPYDTTTINSIVWDGQGNPNISPNGQSSSTINANTGKPLCLGTIIKDGRTFYVYQSPIQYTFLDDGAYKIKVTITGTFASDCGGTDSKLVNVLVGHDDLNITTQRTPAGDCTSKQVIITDNSVGFYGSQIVKWIYDFGDGSPIDTVKLGDANAPNPKVNPHVYPNNQLYYIKLTTINSIGGVSSDSFAIDLSFGLTSTFVQSQDSICPSSSVTFTATSSSSATKWFWDFGDRSNVDSTTGSSITHSFPATSNTFYVIQHWVKNSAGCPSGIFKDTVYVVHKPVANFNPPSGVCLPGLTLFTNTSDTSAANAGMPYTYHWSFGTGVAQDTSNAKNPSFQYTANPPSGGYIVTLTATNKYGCVSSVAQQAITNVYTKPTAIIANTSTKRVCENSLASFYDGSTATNQTINGWYWNFSDGGTATTQNPTHAFSPNKTDTIKLVVTTDKGCVSDTAKYVVKVDPKPVVGTILPSSCISSGSLLFKDASTIATDDSTQTPYTYTWDFGDATGVFTSKDSTHKYASIGTYYIQHSITTVNGCTDKKTDTFTISGSKPVSNYNVPVQGGLGLRQYCARETISLIDSSTIAIGTIKKVVIYWDTSATRYPGANLNTTPTVDNNPQNGVMPITPKTYTFKYPYSQLSKNPVIRVLTYNSDSCYSDTLISISIFGQPTVKFDTLRGICADGAPKKINLAYDSTTFFDAFNYIRLAKKPTYSGTGVYNDSMFNPTIAGAGTHLIQVIYETKQPALHHCFDTAYAPITVWALPTVDFDTALIKCEKSAITFTDKSTAGAGSGNIKNWSWNFGDPTSGAANTSTINPTAHTYNAWGSYSVTLKVTSDSGCANTSAPKTISIYPKPQAGFIPPKGACAGMPVTFVDNSKIADSANNLLTQLWIFGDPTSASNTGTGKTPQHLYSGGATDSVRLYVTSSHGCTDSAVKVVNTSITFPIITPSYKINGAIADTNRTYRTCLGTAFSFSSSVPANSFNWILGDSAGVNYSTATVTHTYPAATTYKGSFSVVDTNGCPSKVVPINVEIWGLPTAKFDTSLIKCEKAAVTFTDKSTAPSNTGTIVSWLWNFGNSTSSTQQNPNTVVYNTWGKYNVTLKVISDSGCINTSSPVAITINPKPKAAFKMQDTICLPNAAKFIDATTIADGSVPTNWTWNFGDVGSVSNTSFVNPASHIYTSSNAYIVTLIVGSANGCLDTLPQTLQASKIHNVPVALYTVNTANHDTPRVCLGVPITFADISSNVSKSYWDWNDGTNYDSGLVATHTYTSPSSFNSSHYIIDNFGCRSYNTPIYVIIDAIPTVKDDSIYILSGYSANLIPTITNAVKYKWSVFSPSGLRNDYLDYDDVLNPLCTPLDDVTYKIMAYSGGGCASAPGYYKVKVLKNPQIPSAFSPNGDGINDTWEIGELQNYAGATVQVFNRWGQLVYTKLGYNKPWNGKYMQTGNDLPIGVYYYIIQAHSNLPAFTGTVTILR